MVIIHLKGKVSRSIILCVVIFNEENLWQILPKLLSSLTDNDKSSKLQVNLAQAVVYMARAPKSVEVYQAYSNAKSCVLEHEGPLPSVPLPLRSAPTQLMKKLGFGAGYKYNPDYDEPVQQIYLPEELKSVNFFAQFTNQS